MKHTPGPWRVGHWQDNGHAIYSEKPVGIIIKGGVSEANARLIASVPDLLQLAEDISRDPYALTPDQWATEARVVIDKVEGGE